MRGSRTIPVIFGILFFSTILSTQDVYGPHFTTFDGIGHHFQGTDSFFDVFINISDGIANPKKSADFQVCVHLDKVVDSTIPTEIVALDLSSCEPITVVGESDQKNFVLSKVMIPTEPLSSTSQRVDVSGFYEIINPGGQSVAGRTVIDAKGVELGPLACIPPTCENSCNGHGVCVADDTCACEKGWDSDVSCSVPDCETNEDCSDANQCTVDVCHDNQCVSAPIPECDPDNRCTSNEQCSSPNECTVGFCDSIGTCQFTQIPGCTTCEPSGDEVCDGIDNDCDPSTPDGFDESWFGVSCDGTDSDLCNEGVFNCVDGTRVCSDTSSNDVDVCDGLDNDCDGTTDNGFAVGDSCGQGNCAGGTVVCSGLFGAVCSTDDNSSPESDVESCTDGIDNDCDGLTDCEDDNCRSIDLGATCALPFCGDGNVDEQAGEACDDGGQTATCDDDCTVPQCGDGTCNQAAGEDGISCSSDCGVSFCGDNIVDTTAGEQCDDGAIDTATCDSDCTTPVCGDGHHNPAVEECDDGNDQDLDTCSNTCRINDFSGTWALEPTPTTSCRGSVSGFDIISGSLSASEIIIDQRDPTDFIVTIPVTITINLESGTFTFTQDISGEGLLTFPDFAIGGSDISITGSLTSLTSFDGIVRGAPTFDTGTAQIDCSPFEVSVVGTKSP